MNIAIFTNNYLPNPFGVAMSIESFRKEFQKRGHTVYIFAPKFKNYIDENKNVYRFPSLDLTFQRVHFPIAISYSHKMSRILEKLEIDIIHSQHPNLLGWSARNWAKKKNVPLVFTWHTLYDQYAHFVPIIPKKIAAWWAIRNAVSYANSADYVIAPSVSMQKIIENWGVKNKNIKAVSTGVDENIFLNLNRAEARKKIGILNDEKVLLLISRLTAEKNVLFLAEKISSILKENSKVKFVIAGDGSEKEKMRKIFIDSDIEQQVMFLGIVERKDIGNIFSLGDIFVYASKSETQGMIISEAMYAGLPVVALDATGIKDFVENGVTGFLTKEKEEEFLVAVRKLLSDESLCEIFSLNCQKIAKKKYIASISAEKMLKIYQKAIAGKKVK